MTVALAVLYPSASDADLISEMAELLVAGKQDVCDPISCIEFLLDRDVCLPSHLGGLLDRALDKAGQIYIDRDVSRRANAPIDLAYERSLKSVSDAMRETSR